MVADLFLKAFLWCFLLYTFLTIIERLPHSVFCLPLKQNFDLVCNAHSLSKISKSGQEDCIGEILQFVLSGKLLTADSFILVINLLLTLSIDVFIILKLWLFSKMCFSKISEQRGSEQSIGHKLQSSLLLVEAGVYRSACPYIR